MKSSTDPVVLSSFSNGEEAVEYVICCDEGSEIQSSAEFDQSCERQKLQCSVETYPNLWSEPCQLDVSMTQLCSFPVIDNQEIGLICSLRALNNIQKQVILATQFMISNKLDSDLEIQLFTEPDYVSNPLVETAQESMLISANTQSSTRCLPLSKIKRCRIRFRGGLWSETIPTPGTDVHHLVTIPDVGKIVCDSWVTFVDPVVPQKTRWMVVSPVMIGRSHFPDPLKLEVWRGDVRLLEQLAECDEDFSMPVWPAQDDYEIRIFKNNESKDEPQRFNVNIRAISAQLGPRACVVDGSSLLNDSVMKRSLAKVSGKTADEAMPNITTPDFCIYFERRWAYADTILLHVKANGVNIQNNYDDDLVLYGVDDELVLLIPRRRTAVLPFSQKGQLRLGVQSGGTVHLSDYFDIRPSQEAREPGMDCTGMAMLPSGGYLTVTFWQKRDDQFLIHHLTMSLKEERSVKTLTIGSRFVALRTSDDASDVLLSAFVVPKVHTKLNYEDELKRVPSDKLTRQVVQLSPFVYVVPRDYPVATDPNRVTDILTYICLACETGLEVQWSYPRQIKESKNKKTFVATITAPVFAPVDGSNVAGLCFRMTAVEDNGVCYYLFERTDSPNLILMNNCPYPISFGECVRKGGGVVTFEEKELFQPLPSVQPGATASYSFPGHDEQFPNVYRASPIYRLRLGRAVKTGSAQAVVVWSSTSVDPYAALNDCFVSVPGVCYLKLHFERENRHTIRISIDPLSRVGTPILLPTLAPPKSVALSELPSPPPLSSRASTPATALLPPTPLNVGISCLLKSVILTVDDEISNPSVIAEVLRLSVDDTSVQFYCDGQTTKTYECAVNISDIQLDNQLYKCGFFDFPVILAKENPAKNVQSVLNVLCKLNSSTLRPENVHISLAPVACFLEDTFAFHLLRLVDTYLAPALLVSDAEKSGASTEAMISRFQRMSVPVVLERIHVAPVEMYLSIHASLKMFVALDKTPLSFGEIECNDVNSTVTDVWNFVMSHYIRGTLLRAGWVIGSMDLLGNPASLLRSLTSGCNDLFVRPFSSLHAGPVSFLNGLAEGASSFLSSVSAGTLSSLTNLAESLSRNLDRVSLDADHVVRQMEVKYRQHPEGLGSGLRQGLTGFGMGILGAVAGLVDQPMQAVMQPQLTPAQMVTALVLGITKGMVGAMSKPIAGAAGLVSKTGQGILRGHGFSNFPPRRFDAPLKLAASFMESTLKYIWKVAPLLPNNVRTLCVVEAIPAVKSSEGDTSDPMCLFLTDSALFVISSADDEFRQAYSLSKLNIRINQSSPWSNKDLVQVTLLIEMDMEEKIGDSTEDFSWPWMTWNNCAVVISPTHSREIIGAHVNKESFLLEWKDAKLFEELFLVAKSGV